MRRAVLVDTGPLYATLDPRDERFEQAREDVSHLDSEGLSVALSFPVLCEGYSLVLYRLGTRRARAWLGEVRGRASLVNPSPGDYEAAVELVRRRNRRLERKARATGVDLRPPLRRHADQRVEGLRCSTS